MADPTGASFLGLEKVVEWLWTLVLAVVGAIWKMLHNEIREVKKTAANAMPRAEFQGYQARSEKVRDETRDTIKILFDRFSEHNEDDRARHSEIMNAIHANHTQILLMMNSKADK
jgi:hypothetical protein